ncbi:hypothetical protein [Flavobacterium gilvum]|uniref:DUF4468 domain-containing protein n=1 Tax=Flavobacterium gilvum TaxID=1492737 RepID=A0AAC9I9I1_9FLAO|nr:hypothetical protein [Flavobacterium gilvum]AOW11117.1 hypothetical protein EM308_17415 [Flavobacterium gilvum]KFC61046.1 hypothetical protein FEM08_01680 [Flavobacterium gilvum]
MKYLLKTALIFWIAIGSAQTKLELTPKGFLPLEIAMPNHPINELIEMSKDWAYSHYFVKGCDIFDVTTNSLTIEAPYENAYYYRNLGVEYDFDIKYTLKIVFGENQKYTLTFTVKEIYINNNPIKTTVTDFFTSEGILKDAFKEAKPSLEISVNKIIKSYTKYIAQ